MDFELKKEYIESNGDNFKIYLPDNNVCTIIMRANDLVNGTCDCCKIEEITCAFLEAGFFGSFYACGNCLIALNDKFDDLTDKKTNKVISKQLSEVLEHREKLKNDNPLLFDASTIDTSKIEKIDYFILTTELVEFGKSISDLSTIYLPDGKPYSIDLNKYIGITTGCQILESKIKTSVVTGGMGFNVSGDALITMVEMGYDLSDAKQLKKAKNEFKDDIQSKFKSLIVEKPELFDSNKIDFEKIESDKGQKKLDEFVTSSLDVDIDKFTGKKTITSSAYIKHDMADIFAGISAGLKSYNNVLDAAKATVQFLTLTPRYVEAKDFAALVIDLKYTGNDWIFFEHGSLIFLADGNTFTFKSSGKTSDVHGGGKVDENLYYIIPINDFESISKSSSIEIQISGKSNKVEFQLDDASKSILNNFYTGVFDSEKPLADKSKVNGIIDSSESTSSESSDSENSNKVDVKSELKKFKEMLDDGLITQDDFDAKKKDLLGL